MDLKPTKKLINKIMNGEFKSIQDADGCYYIPGCRVNVHIENNKLTASVVGLGDNILMKSPPFSLVDGFISDVNIDCAPRVSIDGVFQAEPESDILSYPREYLESMQKVMDMMSADMANIIANDDGAKLSKTCLPFELVVKLKGLLELDNDEWHTALSDFIDAHSEVS